MHFDMPFPHMDLRDGPQSCRRDSTAVARADPIETDTPADVLIARFECFEKWFDGGVGGAYRTRQVPPVCEGRQR